MDIRPITPLIIIAVVLMSIIGLGLWTIDRVSDQSDALLSHSDNLETSIGNEQWPTAQEHLNNLMQAWQNAKPLWTVLLDHKEIDNMDISLARIDQYLLAEDKSLSLSEISVLKLLIRHIPEKEKLTLGNIF
jgi:ATP-dependent exoDNAse (exonuclease V) beta subunit